jgi:hypothetical protein
MTGLCSEAWGERSGGTFGEIFRAEVTIVTEWNTWDVEQRPGPPSSAPHTYVYCRCIPSRARAFGADDLHAQLADEPPTPQSIITQLRGRRVAIPRACTRAAYAVLVRPLPSVLTL